MSFICVDCIACFQITPGFTQFIPGNGWDNVLLSRKMESYYVKKKKIQNQNLNANKYNLEHTDFFLPLISFQHICVISKTGKMKYKI